MESYAEGGAAAGREIYRLPAVSCKLEKLASQFQEASHIASLMVSTARTDTAVDTLRLSKLFVEKFILHNLDSTELYPPISPVDSETVAYLFAMFLWPSELLTIYFGENFNTNPGLGAYPPLHKDIFGIMSGDKVTTDWAQAYDGFNNSGFESVKTVVVPFSTVNSRGPIVIPEFLDFVPPQLLPGTAHAFDSAEKDSCAKNGIDLAASEVVYELKTQTLDDTVLPNPPSFPARVCVMPSTYNLLLGPSALQLSPSDIFELMVCDMESLQVPSYAEFLMIPRRLYTLVVARQEVDARQLLGLCCLEKTPMLILRRVLWALYERLPLPKNELIFVCNAISQKSLRRKHQDLQKFLNMDFAYFVVTAVANDEIFYLVTMTSDMCWFLVRPAVTTVTQLLTTGQIALPGELLDSECLRIERVPRSETAPPDSCIFSRKEKFGETDALSRMFELEDFNAETHDRLIELPRLHVGICSRHYSEVIQAVDMFTRDWINRSVGVEPADGAMAPYYEHNLLATVLQRRIGLTGDAQFENLVPVTETAEAPPATRNTADGGVKRDRTSTPDGKTTQGRNSTPSPPRLGRQPPRPAVGSMPDQIDKVRLENLKTGNLATRLHFSKYFHDYRFHSAFECL